jgi:hypothetical protein
MVVLFLLFRRANISIIAVKLIHFFDLLCLSLNDSSESLLHNRCYLLFRARNYFNDSAYHPIFRATLRQLLIFSKVLAPKPLHPPDDPCQLVLRLRSSSIHCLSLNLYELPELLLILCGLITCLLGISWMIIGRFRGLLFSVCIFLFPLRRLALILYVVFFLNYHAVISLNVE